MGVNYYFIIDKWVSDKVQQGMFEDTRQIKEHNAKVREMRAGEIYLKTDYTEEEWKDHGRNRIQNLPLRNEDLSFGPRETPSPPHHQWPLGPPRRRSPSLDDETRKAPEKSELLEN